MSIDTSFDYILVANNTTKELLDHLVFSFLYSLSEVYISHPLLSSSPTTTASTGMLIDFFDGSTLIAINKTDGSAGS